MSTVDELIASNPFPGLRSFATSEADLFFGRRQQVEEVAARLDAVSFVAVTGSSGCGKSSLVLAGLLSELARRAEAGSGTKWCSAVLRPGNKPIARLAGQLSRLFGGDGGSDESRAGALYGRLRLGGLGLVDAVSLARLDPQTRVLVVVDQFEEIFRFKRMTDPDEASAFVKLLLNAGRDPASPVSVVLTLRSDTLGYCADFRDLPETINAGQYLVPRLTRGQRKETIVGPVELRGFKIAPRLVQRLLNDVSDDFDDLPVMQHALSRSWSRWAQACQGDRPIDLEDYDAVGTTRNALSNHAEEAFDSLPGLEPVVEKVFRALTERIGEGTEIRRPLDFDRLCQVVGAEKDQVERVVERFRQPDTAFLWPPRPVPLAENPVIDISHESLIRQWQRLRGWVQAEAESRAMLVRLVEAAGRYHARQGSRWRKQDLAKALEWQRATKPTPAWVALQVGGDGVAAWESAKSFLAASADGARSERWRGRLQVAGGLALLLAILAAFVAVDLRKRAWSRELANDALLEIDQDPARSAYLALAAVDHDPTNARAEYALRHSLATLEIAHAERILPHAEPVVDARYSRDGSRLVTASGKTVTIFDSGTFDGKRTTRMTRDANVLKAWLIAQNTILVTHTDDGRRHAEVQVQKVGDPTLRRLPCSEGDENWVTAVTVSADERHLALGCATGAVLVWDASDPAAPRGDLVRRDPTAQGITALAFSGDGAYLAGGDTSGTVNVWKVGHREAWIPGRSGIGQSPIKHAVAVRDIAFHPTDSSLLVTAADDAQAEVWTLDLERRRLEPGTKDRRTRWTLKHERPVTAARFTLRRDDTHPVVTVSEKTVRIWVDADARQIRGHDDWVTDANASPDGERIVTASSDGTARIWSTRSGSPIAVLRGHRDAVTRAVFSPDGNQVVTASTDRTVRVWRFRAPRLLSYSEQWALSAAFEPDGTRVAVGEEGGQGSVLELNDLAGGSVPVRHDLPVPQGAGQVSYMSWSRDRKLLVARATTGDIFVASRPLLWDLETGQDITPSWLLKTRMAAFGPGTDELVAVAETGLVGIWDVKSLAEADPRPKLEFAGPPWIWMPAMSPDGKWIAALDGDKVALWRRDEPDAPPMELMGHQGEVMALQFSRDSKWLLTASRDRTARIWSLDPPGPAKTLRGGHTASLYSASFDPRGELVVTGGADGTIRVWDAETANQLAVLRWHGEGVNEVQFGPDGKWILSASDDGTVKLGQCEACNLSLEELRARVPELAKLTEKETEEIRGQAQVAMRYFKRPAFLRRERRAEIKP